MSPYHGSNPVNILYLPMQPQPQPLHHGYAGMYPPSMVQSPLPAINTSPTMYYDELSESGESLSSGEQSHFVATKKRRQLTSPDEAMYKCRQCGKGFGRVWNYKAHQETHNPSRKKEFTCTSCPKDFVRKNDLDRHISSKHLKTKEFECSMCCRKFARKDTLQRHESDGCPNRERQGKAKSTKVLEGSSNPLLVSPLQDFPGLYPFGTPQTSLAMDHVPRKYTLSEPSPNPGPYLGGSLYTAPHSYIQYGGDAWPQYTYYH